MPTGMALNLIIANCRDREFEFYSAILGKSSELNQNCLSVFKISFFSHTVPVAKISYKGKEQVCSLMWSCDFMPAILIILSIFYPLLRDNRSGRLGVDIRCAVV